MQKLSKRPAPSLSKGFTIIELIVVIAIIAVLAGIVLVNVQQYVNKSKNAAVEANLKALPTIATSAVEGGGNLDSICASNAFVTALTAASNNSSSVGDYICWDNTGSWHRPPIVACNNGAWIAGAWTNPAHSGWWCVDSTGAVVLKTSDGPVGGGCSCQSN
jgi:prepilin-type N-terminal cleavage/methylation domain-containing protein